MLPSWSMGCSMTTTSSWKKRREAQRESMRRRCQNAVGDISFRDFVEESYQPGRTYILYRACNEPIVGANDMTCP